MGNVNPSFELPAKIDQYLATLSRLYEKQGETHLREIVVNGIVSVTEEVDYDNWNGGQYGHALTLTLSEDLYTDEMNNKDEHEKRIDADLNLLNNVQNEHISAVEIEMEPVGSGQWREKSGVLRPRTVLPSVPSGALTRIWGDGKVRVFLSHRDKFKKEASELKDALTRCGVASFVAHEDIHPTEEWLLEIERALFSMDALVALLTDDFHESEWTDQEVGVAIGRRSPVIAIRLGKVDPYGMMGKSQGLNGCSSTNPIATAAKIFGLLHKTLPERSCLFDAALSAYSDSKSWSESGWNVEHLLSKFETLTANQVKRVLHAYEENDQNWGSFNAMSYLKPLLERWTGKGWTIEKNRLVPENDNWSNSEDEIPF